MVDDGSRDPHNQNKEAEGGTEERLKEATESMAAILKQKGTNQNKVTWGLDNGTYVGDGLPPVP